MKKKLISVLLSTVMVASMVGCGDSSTATEGASETTATQTSSEETQTTETTEEEYHVDTIKMVVNGSFLQLEDGQEYFEEAWEAAIKERFGYDVDLQITQLDHSGYKDALGRMFASGDYPDVVVMGAETAQQYSTTGLFWDMSEAYDNAEFQSRMNLKEINERAKDSEGHLYRFSPAYGNGCVTYVKQSWLDAVGINADDIKTFDDYYNMLLAFHNGDPDGNGVTGDTYGVVAAGYLGVEAPYINYLPEFWQDAYPAILQDENGVWYDGFQTDATKAALERIRQGVEDGAIDPETFTASTKIAREKWFSVDQTGSSGVFTYWAGKWYQNLTNNMEKNGVETTLVELPPIEEITSTVGGYLNREAGGWCIIDDGDGDDSREKSIFKLFIETMLDGDEIQTLWTYGVEDVHWSTHAETFTTNAGTDKEKVYTYEEGQFHLRPSLSDPNTILTNNHIDPALVVSPLTNGYTDSTDLIVEGNEFFTANCVDAPVSPSSETYTEEAGTIHDAKMAVISAVIVDGEDVDTAMQTYIDTVGETVNNILDELNAQ